MAHQNTWVGFSHSVPAHLLPGLSPDHSLGFWSGGDPRWTWSTAGNRISHLIFFFGLHCSSCASLFFPSLSGETDTLSIQSWLRRWQRLFKEHVCVLSAWGSALEHLMISIRSQPLHFCSGAVCLCRWESRVTMAPICSFFICHFITWPFPPTLWVCRYNCLSYSWFYGWLCCSLHPEGLWFCL